MRTITPRGTYRDFTLAREYARGLRLKSREEWNERVRSGDIPPDIPDNPQLVYEGWVSWPDWLRPPKQWLPFRKARRDVRELRLSGYPEWEEWASSKARPKLDFGHSGCVAERLG